MSIRYTPEYHDHQRDYLKHEIRPGDRGFSPPSGTEPPARLDPPIKGALEIAILAQAVPLQQAAELIERYVAAECAAAKLDAVSQTIDRCCAEIEKHGARTDA